MRRIGLGGLIVRHLVDTYSDGCTHWVAYALNAIMLPAKLFYSNRWDMSCGPDDANMLTWMRFQCCMLGSTRCAFSDLVFRVSRQSTIAKNQRHCEVASLLNRLVRPLRWSFRQILK